MVALRLRQRYVLTVLAVGTVLTLLTAIISFLLENQENRHVLAAITHLEAIGAAAVQPAVAAARDELQLLLASTLIQRLSLILGLGFALTIVAGLVTRSLISRIDRALSAAMANAQRIGQGVRSEPVPVSGVPEVAAIERSLENMRQALASTTISRDFLDDVLNSMSDAVLVMSPNGRVRSANAAASELFGYSAAELPGTIVSELIAPEHREAFDERGLEAGVGETVVRTQRGQTIPVAVSLSPLESPDASNRGTILVLRDITDRKRAERRIRYLARFDTLTKMPNRMQFQHLLHQSITRNHAPGQRPRAAVRGRRQFQGSERHLRARDRRPRARNAQRTTRACIAERVRGRATGR